MCDNMLDPDEIVENHKRRYAKKSFSDQIEKLGTKGIKFEKCSKEEAELILRESNYYYKLTVYKRNFRRDANRKFYNLDFSYLVDIARMDMRLRYLLLGACLDIEHALKTYTLAKITDNEELDGYDIVRRFFHSTSNTANPVTEESIMKRARNNMHYQHKLFTTHMVAPPIWVIMEVISFGDFLRLFEFYFEKYPDPNLNINSVMGVLNGVRKIRNAAAHNNAIIFNLSESAIENASLPLKNYASEIRVGKLFYQCNKIHDILCVFYAHKVFVKGKNSKDLFVEDLENFIVGFEQRLEYVKNDNDIKYLLEIMTKVVDNYKELY